MTQKEQKNQIKNLLACAERLLCCMTEVQQDMDELYRYLWRDRDKKSYGIFYVRGKACFNRTAAAD